MKDENKPATKADVRQIVKTELRKELKKELKDVVRKKDIEDVVRKKDIEDVVRKKDIEDVVRKKDIEDVVRKKDLEKYATKDWVEKWIRRAEDIYATKDWVIENMYTKKDHEKTLTILDAIVQRLDDMSLDFKLLANRTDRLEDTGENHEKRITKLERKVLT